MTRRQRMRYCAARRAFYPRVVPLWVVVVPGDVAFAHFVRYPLLIAAFDLVWALVVIGGRVAIWKRRHPIVVHNVVVHVIADQATRDEMARNARWN